MRSENRVGRDIIQIAGVRDEQEARLLIDLGVDYVGFPLGLDVHGADTSEIEAARIIRSIEPPPHPVLITYLEKADQVHELCKKLGTSLVQLHGDIARTELEALKRLAPSLVIIKSLVVGKYAVTQLEEMQHRLCPYADGFIVDTYDPETGASGATGKTHDWELSRRLVENVDCPVILAGGLRPDNVGEAIRFVRPAGVDAHTGVENAQGAKDAILVKRFIAEARTAFRTT